jgi:colanic acid biosynthesis protein WcaH
MKEMVLNRDEFLEVVRRTPLVSIDLIVWNPKGQVLLGWRKNEPAKDCWFVPGGRVCKEERMADAFQRVCLAEMGVSWNITEARFRGVFEHLYTTNFAKEAGVGTHYIVLGYELTLATVPEILPVAQHDQYRRFDVEDVLSLSEIHEYTKAYFLP